LGLLVGLLLHAGLMLDARFSRRLHVHARSVVCAGWVGVWLPAALLWLSAESYLLMPGLSVSFAGGAAYQSWWLAGLERGNAKRAASLNGS
jgi:hypothetical protein